MSTLDELLVQVDAARDDIVKLEQDLVRIPSVNTGFMPTGNETAVCDYIRDWLAEDGVDSETLESAPGRGNIIASLKGRSDSPGLMFMAHLDVVPVEDETKWTYPPFSATIANGRIYGRGSSDCKALLTAQMMASRILLRNSVELKDDLLLSFSADEEHGGRYGVGWLADNHPEKITAPYAVNEGGGQPADAAGNLAYIVNLGRKGSPPDRDRGQGRERPRLRSLDGDKRALPCSPGARTNRALRAGARHFRSHLPPPLEVRH